ncbi:peptidyl-prolyl cis-trans isomerase [Vibrio sp. MACH09]|uniref:peptidylprolyl isomerase n=1 Tax=unclassified Vibrio TaxID=2614977 RepID=UPI00149373E5|nr:MULTISPECIES: peptidylprolyl isomerase [unclassified Vibrio]NOI64902.1 peptidyl-prolyl cis-trans isomerase [Vibrio sp. 99-8-1]GLO61668.1 peptidyl-prolyl cis-trans isomerase [Vibrio sp. MACH09]
MKKTIIALACLFSASLMAAPNVIFETTQGNFTVELDSENAPVTTENFLKYVEDGSYEGTIFHRVIPTFMAQGGGFDTDMKSKPSYPAIKNEGSNGLKNKVATIAMARTSNPDSATRQFFINYADNDFLDYQQGGNPGYAVFGKVTKGFENVQSMAKQPTKSFGRYHDVPATAIVINKVTVQK